MRAVPDACPLAQQPTACCTYCVVMRFCFSRSRPRYPTDHAAAAAIYCANGVIIFCDANTDTVLLSRRGAASRQCCVNRRAQLAAAAAADAAA